MINNNINIMDVTLRDGSYEINFQFSTKDQEKIANSLQNNGIRYIEIGHGMGIGASTPLNGIALHTDIEYLENAKNNITKASYGVFCIPGIASLDDVDLAADYGCKFIRIGSNVNDVDKTKSYIKRAKDRGLLVAANYMKSYAVPAVDFAEMAKKSESWGADIIYIVDSAGGMLPDQLKSYYEHLRKAISVQIGFHGHDNIGLALPNSILMAKLGTEFIDCSLQGMGRSSGNTSLENFVIYLIKNGYDFHGDIISLLQDSKRYVYPLMKNPRINPIDVVCGLASFHTSYLKHIYKIALKKEVNPLLLIIEYSKIDQVGMDVDALEKIAAELPKDTDCMQLLDFLSYYGDEQSIKLTENSNLP